MGNVSRETKRGNKGGDSWETWGMFHVKQKEEIKEEVVEKHGDVSRETKRRNKENSSWETWEMFHVKQR